MPAFAVDRVDGLRVHVSTDKYFGGLLAVLLTVVYVQGYMERIGVPGNMVKMVIELPVLGILLHLVNRGIRQPPPGFVLIGLYAVWTVLSAIYHGDGIVSAILYCRYVLYAYIVFAAVWYTPMTRTAVARINMTIAGLFLFQIAASAYEVFVLGERVEAHVGALCANGGALATEFPLLAMALTVPFFLLGGNPLYLLVSWAFFLIGYASGKRAIYFFGPGLYFTIFTWYAIRVRGPLVLRRVLVGTLVFLGLLPGVLLGMSRSHGIDQEHARSLSQRVTYAVDAALNYTTAEKQLGQTTGRTATNRRVLSAVLNDSWQTIVFGRGPAAMREGKKRYYNLMIFYGICGWAQDAICIGWPGMTLYLLFHLQMFHRLRLTPRPEGDPRWRAMRFGAEISFIVFLGVHLSYSSSFMTGGQLSYVYFYLFALMMSPQHRHIVQAMA